MVLTLTPSISEAVSTETPMRSMSCFSGCIGFAGMRKAVFGAGGIVNFVMRESLACDKFQSSAILR